jgi:hypothetical protein
MAMSGEQSAKHHQQKMSSPETIKVFNAMS